MTPTLLSEPGNFFIDNLKSSYCTFAYQGDNDFLERMSNLFYNYGILTTGMPHFIKSNFYYILVPYQRLIDGLKQCFKGELIKGCKEKIEFKAARGDNEVWDIWWDEDKLDCLAQEKTDEFISKVQITNLNIYKDSSSVPLEHRVALGAKNSQNKVDFTQFPIQG